MLGSPVFWWPAATLWWRQCDRPVRALVHAASYPPVGGRSFAPSRGLLYGGPDYAQHANETIVRLAMIETREDLAAVEEICAVDGVDGIFIGRNDLGLNLGKGTSADPTDPEVTGAIDHCPKAAKAAGKRAGCSARPAP
ncbi:MAG: hypothetical protein GY798_27585 [Hyphomicrobiales bacterium]|nr:hypothetical protein [Hyphomicrobiales bacterium]